MRARARGARVTLLGACVHRSILGGRGPPHVSTRARAPARRRRLIVANTSRYVLDLNRAEDDWDNAAVEPRPGSLPPRSPGSMPRGLVWRLTTDGEPALARPLPRAELDARIQALHRPYHAAVQAILTRKQAEFGFALLLAAHSMPSNSTAAARRGLRSPATVPRADVVPGTQGRTTASAAFIDAVDAHAAAHGLSVRHDDPYKGGYSTRHYGRPHAGQHAVQVELARRLYMDRADPRPFGPIRSNEGLLHGPRRPAGAAGAEIGAGASSRLTFRVVPLVCAFPSAA